MSRSLATHRYVGRFAPSPTGPLHLGSLVAAYGSWLLARQAGGEWLIRIEDLDPPREVPGATQMQLQALTAFGLVSDRDVVRQSERAPLYQAAIDQLLSDGFAFHCRCSRSDLSDAEGVHRCCHASNGHGRVSIRLRVDDGCSVDFDDQVHGRVQQDVASEVGDFVLKRADGFWAYQLAVVVDDAEQGVTDVVRGADLLDSTARQILLQRALGVPTPRYTHLPLIVDASGRKLSKSLAACALDPADPIPALRLAWQVLGQAADRLPAAGNLDMFHAFAIEAFRSVDLPRTPLSIAAMQHAETMPHA